MSAEKLRTLLMTSGVKYRTHAHEQAFTARRTAQLEHIPSDHFAKPVILAAHGTFVMAVVPASTSVDLDKAREFFDAEDIRLAEEHEFTALFEDCERGAEPPFGMLYGMGTVVDIGLCSEEVTFSAGSHTITITMDLDDFLAVTRAPVGDIAIARE